MGGMRIKDTKEEGEDTAAAAAAKTRIMTRTRAS
jgi:hypothetical protein